MSILETILFVIIFSLVGYLIHKISKLNKTISNYNENHKKSLAEAGSAITETLRVAFDNLKRNNAEHGKINTKLNEHSSRIHRLEQQNNRSIRDGSKISNIIEKEKENEDE
jgi:cell shape-determining protein MreC